MIDFSTYHYSSQVHDFYQENSLYASKLREVFVKQKRLSVIRKELDMFNLTGHISPAVPNVPWKELEDFYSKLKINKKK